MFNKKNLILLIYILMFLFGNLLILKSNAWDLGDFFSMNLSGFLIASCSFIAFLIEFYKIKK